jgi:hypothetical protein
MPKAGWSQTRHTFLCILAQWVEQYAQLFEGAVIGFERVMCLP